MLRKSTTGYNLAKDWKEHYPVTAHAPNFDFRTGCREIKRCEESKRTLKSPFASRFVEFNTTLKLLRFTDQWYIFPVKLWFERNLDFLALLLLPLAGRASDGKRFDAEWRLIFLLPASIQAQITVCDRVIRPRISLLFVTSRNILLFYYFTSNIFALRNFRVWFSKLVYRLGMIVRVPTNPHLIA